MPHISDFCVGFFRKKLILELKCWGWRKLGEVNVEKTPNPGIIYAALIPEKERILWWLKRLRIDPAKINLEPTIFRIGRTTGGLAWRAEDNDSIEDGAVTAKIGTNSVSFISDLGNEFEITRNTQANQIEFAYPTGSRLLGTIQLRLRIGA
ncbi:MAG: hypothetical protein AAF074_06545 [Pseudomonadota bacterium]